MSSKTPPRLPPGLCVLPRLALASPGILQLVLAHLRSPDPIDPNDLDDVSLPAHYADLRRTSLVSKAWAEASQGELMKQVWLGGGTRQLEALLYAIEVQTRRRGGERYRTSEVVLFDKAPVDFAKVGEGAKWSILALNAVMASLEGVEELYVAFEVIGKGLPSQMIAGDGFKDLTTLSLRCPLTQSQRTPVKLPFSLSSLTLASHEIKTDWVVTGDLLSPVVRNLLSLDLSHFFFPRFESDLFSCLGPAAKNLKMLFLPILVLNPSTYRLALLALCATSLRILRITLASPVLLREILPHFASSPIHTFSLVLFSGIAEPPLITEDPITALQQGLSTWAAATSEQKKRGKSLSVRLGGITNIMGVHRRMGPVFESKGWQGLVFPSLEMKQMMDELEKLDEPFSSLEEMIERTTKMDAMLKMAGMLPPDAELPFLTPMSSKGKEKMA